MENFASLFEASSPQLEMREGEVIKATVVAIDNKYVTVNAGLKSSSFLLLSLLVLLTLLLETYVQLCKTNYGTFHFMAILYNKNCTALCTLKFYFLLLY